MKAKRFRGLIAGAALSLTANAALAQSCPGYCTAEKYRLDQELAYLSQDYPEAVTIIYACALAGAADAQQKGYAGERFETHVLNYVSGCALVYCLVDGNTCQLVIPDLVRLAIAYSNLRVQCETCSWDDDPYYDDDYYGEDDYYGDDFGDDFEDDYEDDWGDEGLPDDDDADYPDDDDYPDEEEPEKK